MAHCRTLQLLDLVVQMIFNISVNISVLHLLSIEVLKLVFARSIIRIQ